MSIVADFLLILGQALAVAATAGTTGYIIYLIIQAMKGPK